ncbi:MAG TPA: nuclear transport factor 2 family protein [Lysobacter sp.]|nr:nuclear transport factor 2 family protein [Lysobacter sp.]
MNIDLPAAVERYVRADSSGNEELLGQCFTRDAVVTDEGRTVSGLDAIQTWKREAKAKYRYQMRPIAASRVGDSVEMTARLTGDFPGSPVELTYTFVLEGDRIASLEIH